MVLLQAAITMLANYLIRSLDHHLLLDPHSQRERERETARRRDRQMYTVTKVTVLFVLSDSGLFSFHCYVCFLR